jgi:hypothetical protein
MVPNGADGGEFFSETRDLKRNKLMVFQHFPDTVKRAIHGHMSPDLL